MWGSKVQRLFFFYHCVAPLNQITIIVKAFASFKFSLQLSALITVAMSRSHISICPALVFQVLQFTMLLIKGPINRFRELHCFSRYSTSAGLVYFVLIHQKWSLPYCTAIPILLKPSRKLDLWGINPWAVAVTWGLQQEYLLHLKEWAQES